MIQPTPKVHHRALRAGRQPTSVVELSSLTALQRELLRGSFAAIADIQKTAEREFPEVG